MKQSGKSQKKFYSQEDIENLSQSMEADMEEMLESSKPIPPYEFSERYESRLEESLKARFGEEKAEEILRRREASRMAAETEAHSHKHSALKSRDKLSGQSFKEKISRFPFSGFAQIASALVIIITVALVFGKNEAKASWWDNVQFIVRSYEDYSRIEAYEEVDGESVAYPETIEKKYIPTKVAEGYEEVAREEMSKQIRIIYADNEKHIYTYTQQAQDMGQHINTEDTKYEVVDTMYGKAYYCKNVGEYQLYWDYDGYMFSIQGDLELSKMLDIVNTIK